MDEMVEKLTPLTAWIGHADTNAVAAEQAFDRMRRKTPAYSIRPNLQAHNRARFAFDAHIEGTAAHLAIGDKPLCRDGGIDDQVKALSAERTLNGFAVFHNRMCRA